jgi:hypothetical protein
MEARMTYRPCKCMDSDGYCTRHFVFATESLKSIDCRRGVIRGVVDVEVCYPSVLTYWLFCLLCPDYTPAEGEDRWAGCVNGKLVFRKPEESNA